MRIIECPKCGEDISDSHQSDEPDVGIIGGYYCDACDLAIVEEYESHDDDVMPFGAGPAHLSERCQNCLTALVPGYGLAGGSIGPYMYCPNEHCKKPTLIKSQDPT